jgi:hypothetical protein
MTVVINIDAIDLIMELKEVNISQEYEKIAVRTHFAISTQA